MVRVEGLSIAYRVGGRRVEALGGAGLEFASGGIGAVVGPSGCGKTSLVQAMAGLLRPESGRVLVEGTEIRGPRVRTAVIFQDFGLLPWKTVEANAELPLLLRGVGAAERRARVRPVLEELGLAAFARFFPARLSGGMKQRLAVARALASGPDLLLMDEPFSSLDALTRESLQDTLLEVQRRHGMTVVIVTHSIDEAAYLADRTYVLGGRNPGRVAALVEGRAAPGSMAGEARGGAEDRRGPAGGASGRESADVRKKAAAIRAALEEGLAAPEEERPRPESTPGWTKRVRRLAAMRILAGLAGALLFCLAWAGIALATGKPFLPGPLPVFARFAERCADGVLVAHLAASARRVLLALALVLPPATALGLAAGRSARLDAFLSPLLYLFYPLPKIAFLPVIMLFLGLGDASKVAVIALIVASQVLVGARDAAKALPRPLFDSVRSLGAGGADLARHVLLPGSMPALLSSLRASLGTSVAVLFFAETFATERGLGYYIMDAWARVDYPDMYAAILALSLFGLLCFAAVDAAEALLCRWRRSD